MTTLIPDVTRIPAPRTPLLDERTGLMSREWYRFFYNLFNLTGSGGNFTSLTDVQKGPPTAQIDEISEIINKAAANVSPDQEALLSQFAEIQKQLNGLKMQIQPELGTMASVQQDNVRFLRFSRNPSPAVVPQIGTLAWNVAEQTAELGMDYGVVQQIGLEYYARVENNTGVTIPDGAVVGFAGVSPANVLSVAPYLADGATPNLYVLGVMTHALPNAGEIGYATVWGHVRGLDTTGTPVGETWNVGDILYASPSTAGAFTNVKPTAPDNVIPVAAVLEVDATNGEIFVRPTIEQEQYYGEFTKTGASTSPASANTSYAVTWDNTEIANGVSIVSNSQITVVESGLYQFDVTLQLQSGSGTDKNVIFWFKKNGTNIPNTARVVTVSVNNAYTPLGLSDFFSLDAGDYVELWWQSDNTNVALVTVAAGGAAPNDYPAAPAGIIAVNQIQL